MKEIDENLKARLEMEITNLVTRIIHEETSQSKIEKIIRAHIKKRVKKQVEEVIERDIMNWLEEAEDIDDCQKNPKTLENIVIKVLNEWRK